MGRCALRSKGRTPFMRQAERDGHVLEVAERLFLEKGYHQVSLALVAASAGVATRTIYASFGDKRSLLEEILECRRAAGDLALASLAAQYQPIERRLHRLAAHAFEHALSPCLDLLHADLLAGRSLLAPAQGRWALQGEWRTLLERTLTPASLNFSDVFIACLMTEHFGTPPPCVGNERSAEAIEGMARRAVARFLELVASCVRAEPFTAPIGSIDKVTR
jgi:AcrR family transcriptional regulator